MSMPDNTTHSPTDADGDGERGLFARATAAAARYRELAPDVFGQRRDAWVLWTLRTSMAHSIAIALGVTVEDVLISHDPDRRHGFGGKDFGSLLTVTDPDTGELCRFIPDTSSVGWLLLGACPDCDASVPKAVVATLADLGDYLDTEDYDLEMFPPDFDGDPAHHVDCPHAPRRG